MREFDNAGSFRPRHLGFIHGLKKAIEQNLPHSSSVVQLKAKGLRLFAPELGGRYEVFEERPLAPEILSCASYLSRQFPNRVALKVKPILSYQTPPRTSSFFSN